MTDAIPELDPVSLHRPHALADATNRYCCPRCATPLDGLDCPSCDRAWPRRHGIPSFLDGSSRDGIASDLADRLETRSLREAVRALEADVGSQPALVRTLFDVRPEDWRLLVADTLSGACLDLYAGYGTRSMVLAEQLQHVTAVEPALSKLRVAAGREDYASAARVRPIHADEDTLPFGENAFETIVADFTGRGDRSLRSRVRRLQDLLVDHGTLVMKLDGWPRRVGLAGTDEPGTRDGRRPTLPRQVTPRGYRRVLQSMGFADVELFALFPTASVVELVYNTASPAGVDRARALVDARTDGLLGRVAPTLLDTADRTGLLERCYPSYLAVCTGRPRESRFGGTDRVLTTGRVRSVVLAFDEGELCAIWKAPNRHRHATFTERENRLLATLADRDDPIVETLPAGRAVETPFGPARQEVPVDGRPLGDALTPSPDAVGHVLEVGVDWLIGFQRAFRGDDRVLDPEEIDALLGFEPAGVDPPGATQPVESFVVPVHGDFTPDNIYVDDGTVTGVIDWEYGALEGSPFVDPAFFVVDTLRLVTGDVETAAHHLRRADSQYGAVARAALERYCAAMGLSPSALDRLLAAPYVRRLRMDADSGAATNQTAKVRVRAEVARFLQRDDR